MADERDPLALFSLRVWGYKQGEVVSLMIHLGDRLGLYRAMTGRGPTTAADLAAATGLQERWLLEWLRSQGAARLIDTEDGETFELSPEAATVLADNDGSLFFAAGAFQGGIAPPEVVDRPPLRATRRAAGCRVPREPRPRARNALGKYGDPDYRPAPLLVRRRSVRDLDDVPIF